MSEGALIILMVTLLRALVTLVGLAFCVLGYKLFVKGVYEKGGELKAAWGDKNLALKQAGPGTFFAFFGLLTVGVGIWRDTGLGTAPSENLTTLTANPLRDGRVIPSLDELIKKHNIKVERLGVWGYPILWNVYMRSIRSGLSGPEVDRLFETAIIPAARADEGKENLPTLTTARDEIFKQMDETTGELPHRYVKSGIGL